MYHFRKWRHWQSDAAWVTRKYPKCHALASLCHLSYWSNRVWYKEMNINQVRDVNQSIPHTSPSCSATDYSCMSHLQ